MTQQQDPDANQEGMDKELKKLNLNGCNNCKFYCTQGFTCAAGSKCKLGNLWELREPVSKTETTEPMTAEELNPVKSYVVNRYKDWKLNPTDYGYDGIGEFITDFTENEIVDFMEWAEKTSQQVSAKDGEWRENIQKRIDELNKLVCEGYDISPNRIDELENLLK